MKQVYLGIDINNKYTMLSIYEPSMSEPQSVTTVAGAENFQIPTYIAKRHGIGQWYFGQDARNAVNKGDATGVDNLYKRALNNEKIRIEGQEYELRDLLVIFFKKVFGLTGTLLQQVEVKKIIIAIDHVTMEAMELFTAVISKIGMDPKKLSLIDYRESFYYYALSQDQSLYIHDVVLFDYTNATPTHCILSRDISSIPQVITLEQGNHNSLIDDRDGEFDRIVKRVFGGRLISAVYLIGDGFDGGWMNESLKTICKNRKCFMGKNLYSKGACFAGIVMEDAVKWPFVYMGDTELKINLSLRVYDNQNTQYLTLLTAGANWFDSKGECEVILDGTPEIEFFLQRPDSRQAQTRVLLLDELPERENRLTRLRIEAHATSDTQLSVSITDLGFGAFTLASGKTWEQILFIQ